MAWLTAVAAAKVLGVKNTTVIGMVRRGLLQAHRLGSDFGSRYRIAEDDVLRLALIQARAKARKRKPKRGAT